MYDFNFNLFFRAQENCLFSIGCILFSIFFLKNQFFCVFPTKIKMQYYMWESFYCRQQRENTFYSHIRTIFLRQRVPNERSKKFWCCLIIEQSQKYLKKSQNESKAIKMKSYIFVIQTKNTEITIVLCWQRKRF
jgi:hypothetical protein